jgi:hypothetical protein
VLIGQSIEYVCPVFLVPLQELYHPHPPCLCGRAWPDVEDATDDPLAIGDHIVNQLPTNGRKGLLGTALVTRGMKPDEAYKIALYYIEGPGRGLTWITALNEQYGSEKGEATSRTNAEAA